MDVAALNLDLRARGVEVFILQFTLHAAVDRVGEIGAEGLHVEEIHAAAHLLVGGEADADLAVFHLGVRHEVFRGGHNFRNAGLVVGAQQRRAVGVDQGVALEEGQLGEVRNPHRQLAVQGDVAAVVLVDHAGFHLLAAHVGRGVDVGDEADDGGVLAPFRGGDGAHHVAVLVHRDLGHAQGLHLVAQGRQEDLLFFGRGECRALLRRLGVVGDVFQKTFFQVHCRCRLNVILPFWPAGCARRSSRSKRGTSQGPSIRRRLTRPSRRGTSPRRRISARRSPRPSVRRRR